MSWINWLIIAGIFFILEMVTTGFLIFWIGIGAILALVTSLVTTSVPIQLTIFVVSSVALIFFTKPLTDKYLIPKDVKTNKDSLIGKHGIVTKTILPVTGGQAKIGSEIWSAMSENETEIKEGEEIEVIELSGVKTVVKKIKS